MNPPENFTNGDIPDELFNDAFGAALGNKSKISITQTLKHGGMSPEMIDLYADQIIEAGKRERMRPRRPHILIGWGIIVTGAATFLYMLPYGYLAAMGILIVMAGLIFLSRLRD